MSDTQTKAQSQSEMAKVTEEEQADPQQAAADAEQAWRDSQAERAQAEIDAQKKGQESGVAWSAESPPDEIVNPQALAEEEAAKAESGGQTSKSASSATGSSSAR